MQFPFSFFKPSISWPTGKDGDLHILSGQVTPLNPGDIKDYNSITIDAGGAIQVVDGGAPVVIGCKGLFTNNGQILYNQSDADGTFSITAPDGTVFSYTVSRGQGGNGGDSGNSNGAPGGSSNGGGGGAEFSGQNPDFDKGGDGGSGDDQNGFVSGGGGSNDESFPGDVGADAYGPSADFNTYAGGGGGGRRGFNGGGIYINAAGGCAGTGEVIISAQDGSSGGDGGFADGAGSNVFSFGGGGGGSGSGGSGGKGLVRYHGAAPTWTWSQLSGSAGSAGVGGGAANSGGADFAGNDGTRGTDGTVGSHSLVAY